MKWRFLFDEALPAARNMAIDEAIMIALIEKKTHPTIRFYDWQIPTLSYGYHQQAENEIDFEILAEKGYHFVRRPTGGRMVLHKQEVTYSVIAPITGRLGGSVSQSYLQISMALAKGLQLMGIDNVEMEKSELNPSEQRIASNPCFTSSSRYEIKCGHRKIIGSAQVRKENVLLQHGSILLHYDQSEVADFLPNLENEQKNRLKGYLSKKTVSINQLLEKKINYFTAVDYFQSSFRSIWHEESFTDSLLKTSYENEKASELEEKKYKTELWNFKKKSEL